MVNLDSHIIQSHFDLIARQLIGGVHVFDEIESTNNWLVRHDHCGHICIAEKQSKGKGRRGNNWSSPATGNIYLSMSWCFSGGHPHFPLLSLMIGIGVCDALKAAGLKGHGVKWPNDIFVGSEKLGGILVETSGSLERVVVGIGLNLFQQDQSAIQQPWCSLCHVMDEVPDRNVLIAGIINTLVYQLSNFEKLSFSDFIQQWNHWDIVTGKQVRVLQADAELFGLAQGIDEQGRIKVLMSDGGIQHFHSAEISLRW